MIDHIQEPENEQIEDVQDDDDGKPVSADQLGTITTIEGIMDAIGSVLDYVEVVGRGLSKTEIVAFSWIKRAYNMPSFEQQSKRLYGKQADKFLELTAEFEELISPCDAENPQHVDPITAREKEEKRKLKEWNSRMKLQRDQEEWAKRKSSEQKEHRQAIQTREDDEPLPFDNAPFVASEFEFDLMEA